MGRPVTSPGHGPDRESTAAAGTAAAAGTSAPAGTEDPPEYATERPPRPFVERLGLAAVALFVGGLFILMAAAAWVGREGFLALMAGLGGLMTLWAGFNSLRRG